MRPLVLDSTLRMTNSIRAFCIVPGRVYFRHCQTSLDVGVNLQPTAMTAVILWLILRLCVVYQEAIKG
jgi:hypothetical protein